MFIFVIICIFIVFFIDLLGEEEFKVYLCFFSEEKFIDVIEYFRYIRINFILKEVL